MRGPSSSRTSQGGCARRPRSAGTTPDRRQAARRTADTPLTWSRVRWIPPGTRRAAAACGSPPIPGPDAWRDCARRRASLGRRPAYLRPRRADRPRPRPGEPGSAPGEPAAGGGDPAARAGGPTAGLLEPALPPVLAGGGCRGTAHPLAAGGRRILVGCVGIRWRVRGDRRRRAARGRRAPAGAAGTAEGAGAGGAAAGCA